MIKIIDGDLLASTTDIIAHQVNCKGAFNSGVARAIREYDVQVFHDYRAYCSSKTADKKLNSEAWFDYEVQKMCSIVASMATMAFNRFFMYEYEEFNRWIYEGSPTDEDKRLNDVYYNAMCQGAMFDARVFNIPKEEVTNNIYWRQLDASRNSIQMLGQANF